MVLPARLQARARSRERLGWALSSLPPQLPSDSSLGLLIKARTEGTERRGGGKERRQVYFGANQACSQLRGHQLPGAGQGRGRGTQTGRGRRTPPHELPGKVPPLGKLPISPPPPPLPHFPPPLSHCQIPVLPPPASHPYNWLLLINKPPFGLARAGSSMSVACFHPSPTDQPTQAWYRENALYVLLEYHWVNTGIAR